MKKPQRSYLDRSYQYTGENNPLNPLGKIVNLTGKEIILEIPFIGFKTTIKRDGLVELIELDTYASCEGIYRLTYPKIDVSQFHDEPTTYIVSREVALILYKGVCNSKKIMFPYRVYDENDKQIVCEGFARLDCNDYIEKF